MKKNKHHNIISSVLVVLFCSIGVLGSAYLFYTSIYATITKSDTQVKGKISWKNHAVQRRFSDHLVWNNLATGSDVYEGDLIRTDDLSQASIILGAGTTIDMQENCLIQIATDKSGRLSLQFLSGDIDVKTEQETIFINQGNKQIEVRSNSSVHAITEGADSGISITVDSGDAALIQGEKRQEINSGTELRVNSNGTIQDEKTVTIQSVSSSVQQIQTEEPITPVNLEWKSNGEKVRLDVSSDSRFSNITYSKVQNSTSAAVSLPPGFWWWRVTPIDAKDSGSAEGKVVVTYVDLPPKIVEPVASPVVFSFLTETAPISTIKEINAVQAIQKEPAPQPSTPTRPVPPPSSPAAAAAPQQPALPLLPAPRLLEPDPELNAEAYKTNKNVTFSWTPVADAKAYLWSLQSGVTQTSVIVKETSFVYDASRISNGTYTWQVEALRTVPTTNNVTERGEAAVRKWVVNIPLPKKPVLLEPIQD